MVTLIYSILASNLEPFSNATLMVTDNGQYLLSIPAEVDWTSAEVKINNYPSVDVIISEQIIELSGQFFEPAEEIWIDISIAKGNNFGGSYRFSLDIVPIPKEMPRFAAKEVDVMVLHEPSFWWRDSSRKPKRFFWEKAWKQY
jgi:hypothetical protein